ncbi:MAG: hypothetical protein AAFP16_07335 [Pseudomonadota bacterium]
MIPQGLTWASGLTALSTLLLSFSMLRGLWFVLRARRLDARADQAATALNSLSGQARQTRQAQIDADKARADDLLNFASLLPMWVIALTIAAILLGVAARVIAVFSG